MTVDVYDTLIRFSGKVSSVGKWYQQNPTRSQVRGGRTNRGVELSFAQAATGEALSGTDGVTHIKINCYNYNARGH